MNKIDYDLCIITTISYDCYNTCEQVCCTICYITNARRNMYGPGNWDVVISAIDKQAKALTGIRMAQFIVNSLISRYSKTWIESQNASRKSIHLTAGCKKRLPLRLGADELFTLIWLFSMFVIITLFDNPGKINTFDFKICHIAAMPLICMAYWSYILPRYWINTIFHQVLCRSSLPAKNVSDIRNTSDWNVFVG